jgi:hypothetical protein
MNILCSLGLCALLLSAMSDHAAAQTAAGCDLSGTKNIGDLTQALSRRAVEAVNLAAEAPTKSNPALERLVAPTATFTSGGGDVGLPLGVGVAGLRALARHMKADTFRYPTWSSIPTPVDDPCGTFKEEVEFIDTASRIAFPVTFTFVAGRIVSAEGWSRPFETGPLVPVRN